MTALTWFIEFFSVDYVELERGAGLAEVRRLALERAEGKQRAAFVEYQRTVHGFAPDAPGVTAETRNEGPTVHCANCEADRVLHRGKCHKCGSVSWTPKGREIDARFRKVRKSR